MFEDHKEAEYLSKCFVGQPIGELENLLKHGTGTLEFPFDSRTEANLMRGMVMPLQTTRHLSRSSVSGIIDAVRNMTLQWCLQPEKDGILGEGLVFSPKEKETAAHSNYTINYKAPISHSQVQQGSPHAVQTIAVGETDKTAIADFMRILKKHSPELGWMPAPRGYSGPKSRPSKLRWHRQGQTVRYCMRACAPFATCSKVARVA